MIYANLSGGFKFRFYWPNVKHVKWHSNFIDFSKKSLIVQNICT